MQALVGSVLVGLFTATSPVQATTHDDHAALIEQFRSQVLEGPEIDRVWSTYNELAVDVLARYPALEFLASQNAVEVRFGSREEFAGALYRTLTYWGGGHSDYLRIAATWVREGRMPLGRLYEWSKLMPLAGKRWPAEDLAWLRDELSGRSRDVAKGGTGRNRESPERRREATPNVPERDREIRPRTTSRKTLNITPELIRFAALHAENFLRHYGEVGPGSLTPMTGPELFELYRKSREVVPQQDGDSAEPNPRTLADMPADPAVVRGVERLFAELTEQLLGVSPARFQAAVARLPLHAERAIVVPGYGPLEMAGTPFHRVTTDWAQLVTGSRQQVLWIESIDELRQVIADPEIEELLLWGHARFDSYAYYGVTGLPEVTLAQMLAWVRVHSEQLAPLLNESMGSNAHHGVARLRAYLTRQLPMGWRRLQLDGFQALAQQPGFTPKKKVVLWACGADEWGTSDAPKHLFKELVAVTRQANAEIPWLSCGGIPGMVWFHPTCPETQPVFEERFPQLVTELRARLESDFTVHRRPNFLELIADEHRRFPGISWVHDFIESPEGVEWDWQGLSDRLEVQAEAKVEGGGDHR